jgi:tRNA nucleotidyltransferase/poly(A) polymerase
MSEEGDPDPCPYTNFFNIAPLVGEIKRLKQDLEDERNNNGKRELSVQAQQPPTYAGGCGGGGDDSEHVISLLKSQLQALTPVSDIVKENMALKAQVERLRQVNQEQYDGFTAAMKSHYAGQLAAVKQVFSDLQRHCRDQCDAATERMLRAFESLHAKISQFEQQIEKSSNSTQYARVDVKRMFEEIRSEFNGMVDVFRLAKDEIRGVREV